MHITLADREAELMEVLWNLGPSTVADVRKAIPDQLAYTTVLTVLRTLEIKGYVRHEQEGRVHRYAPAVGRDAARRSALKDLAAKFFGGSNELLMTHLVAEQKLSAAEVKRIKRLLSQKAAKDSK